MAHHQSFRNTRHPPIEICFFTHVLPYGPHFQFIYMKVELWAKHMG